MAEVINTIHVCVDCMFVAVNGETGNETPDREPWGELPTAEVAMAFGGEDDDDVSYFSWSPCQACGSSLGGDRYEFAVFSYGG